MVLSDYNGEGGPNENDRLTRESAYWFCAKRKRNWGRESGRQRAAAAVAANLSQPVGLHDITICTKLPGQDCPYLRTPQAYDWPTSTFVANNRVRDPV